MEQNNSENGGGTFWTLCPYCLFMYEYEKSYEECVLRCQNLKCRRAFTAVAVVAAAVPPPEVVEKRMYTCYGFSPGPNNERGGDAGDKKRKNWWAPFVSMGPGPGPVRVNASKGEVRTNVESEIEKNDGFIEVSDDESEGEEKIGERGLGNGVNGGKVVMKRKKMAAKGTKKLMGKGARVDRNCSLPVEGGEGMGLKVEGNEENTNAREVMEGSNGEGLEFSAGDDDIFVSLNPVADLGVYE